MQVFLSVLPPPSPPLVMVIIPWASKKWDVNWNVTPPPPSRQTSHIFQADESRSCIKNLGLYFTDAPLPLPPLPPLSVVLRAVWLSLHGSLVCTLITYRPTAPQSKHRPLGNPGNKWEKMIRSFIWRIRWCPCKPFYILYIPQYTKVYIISTEWESNHILTW